MTRAQQLRRLIVYIMAGSDHAARWEARADRDIYHACAGVVAALTGVLGPLYAVVVARKQAEDDDDPAAVRDARIDLRVSVLGLLGGAATLALIWWLGGWWVLAGYCAAALAYVVAVGALILRWRAP